MPHNAENAPVPGLTVIIPAHNEARMIADCLAAVGASEGLRTLEVLVVANGCTDDTAARARACAPAFAARGFALEVLELETGGKLGALNAGDARASHPARAYLDADVIVSPPLLAQIATLLDGNAPAYASGQVTIPAAHSAVTRAYARFYRQVPFMTHGVPGCGLFAMNGAGRAQWGNWPDIISDDTFARLSFAPDQRKMADASYSWPLVEGWAALVKVRRRQDAGVDQLKSMYPALFANDDKPAWTPAALVRAILRAPLGFAVYTAVALAVRRKSAQSTPGEWSRGR